MKITSVRATAVEVPVTRIAAYSKRTITHVANTIVEVETDAGISGLGEARGTFCARIVNERLGPAVVGLPVEDHRAIRDACLPAEPFDYGYPEYLSDRNAFGGIEIALWDIAGRDSGRPLYQLLGGPARERAPFVAYAYTVDPAEGRPDEEVARIMADIAAERVAAAGAGMFEYKVGLHPVPCEVRVMRAVHEAVGPDVDLAVDANMGFSMEAARRFLAGTADLPLANVEEPVAGLGMIERLRADFGVPVSHPLRRPRCALAPSRHRLGGHRSGAARRHRTPGGVHRQGARDRQAHLAARAVGARHRVGGDVSPRRRPSGARSPEPGPHRLDRGRPRAGRDVAGPGRGRPAAGASGARRGAGPYGARAVRGGVAAST